MGKTSHREKLIEILLLAYSGELAAAYAYRGHWKSVHKAEEIRGIRKIENEEWVHRAAVGKMLERMRTKPLLLREMKMGAIGRTIGFFCHLTGWFFPMYFAGRLEHTNVKEYDTAAHHAAKLGLKKFEKELLKMARTEQEHEDFFASRVVGHPLLSPTAVLFTWNPAEKSARIKKALS